jgi:hypothetical protein
MTFTTIPPSPDHLKGLQDDLAAARAENTRLRKQLAELAEVVGTFASGATAVFDTVGAEPCPACLADEHAECERPVSTEQVVRQTWTHPAEYVVTECCCGGGES